MCTFLPLMILAPIGAILAALLFRGKGHPEAARLAAWGTGCTLIWPPLLTVCVLVADAGDLWALLAAGASVALGLCVLGNDLLARAASSSTLGGPQHDPSRWYRVGAGVSVFLLVVSSVAVFGLFDRGGPKADWLMVAIGLPTLLLWTLAPLWIGGGGVAMALLRALFAERLYEDDA